MRGMFGALVGTLLVAGVGCNPESVEGTPTTGPTPPGMGLSTAATSAGASPADMSIPEGSACTTTASCMAGLYCDATQKCAPLQIVLTTSGFDRPYGVDVVIVPYKPAAGTTMPTRLNDFNEPAAHFPRWGPDGKTVAFVQFFFRGGLALVSRAVPLVTGAGSVSTLTTGSAAGAEDFRFLDWEPSASLLWTTWTYSSASGIKGIAPGGSLSSYTSAGSSSAWSADGSSFVYSANPLGLSVHSVSDGTESPVPGVTSGSAQQPLYSKASSTVLYLDAGGRTASFGGTATPLTSLFSSASGTALAEATANETTPGTVNSYLTQHTWSPTGTHVAYVRVNYTTTSAGASSLCTGGSSCGGTDGNVLYVLPMNADGTPKGTELLLASNASLPSFSPDGQFIAYVSGGKLKVQQINPAATDAASLKVGALISHNWSSGSVETFNGSDDRPRWQPR